MFVLVSAIEADAFRTHLFSPLYTFFFLHSFTRPAPDQLHRAPDPFDSNTAMDEPRKSEDWGVTFSHQNELPKLPIPSLEQTCERYLAMVAPLQTPAQTEKTKAAVFEVVELGTLARMVMTLARMVMTLARMVMTPCTAGLSTRRALR